MTINHKSRLLFQVVAIALSALSILSSCKKSSNEDDDSGYEVSTDIRDSAYLITKDIYLWYDRLPSISVFQPKQLTDLDDVMSKVRSYQPLDQWSFAETKAETEQTENGQSTDFGFMVKVLSPTEIRVSYVYQKSDAGKKGVRRTWQISKINNRSLNMGVQNDVDYINNTFFGSSGSAEFEFIKPDNSHITLTLSKTQYDLNTVLFKNVYVKGNKKIGYLVFNEFSSHNSVIELQQAFSYFEQQAVNEMIVDLRYNRGGYVSTQDTLANLLAPLSVGRKQKLMYTYAFNKNYSSENFSTKFDKLGNLNLSRVLFIVSPASASASELLINNLRPVMSTILIGDTRTYGKPVGFFPIPVGNFNIFPVSFKTINSAGEADFFGGFAVNKNVVDNVLHDFGDEREANLKQALSFLSTGSYIASTFADRSGLSSAEIQKVSDANASIVENIPSYSIENRPEKMPKSVKAIQR